MAGYAVMGATEHDVRDLPGVYLGNVCGLRSSISAGGGGLVVRPLCIPGQVYEEAFVSPLSGQLLSRVLIRETVSGSSAVLRVEVDGRPVGELDLLTLEADTPAEIDFGGAVVEGGDSVITVRTECSGDVSPGAGLMLTFGGVGEDLLAALMMLIGVRKTNEEPHRAEPVP